MKRNIFAFLSAFVFIVHVTALPTSFLNEFTQTSFERETNDFIKQLYMKKLANSNGLESLVRNVLNDLLARQNQTTALKSQLNDFNELLTELESCNYNGTQFIGLAYYKKINTVGKLIDRYEKNRIETDEEKLISDTIYKYGFESLLNVLGREYHAFCFEVKTELEKRLNGLSEEERMKETHLNRLYTDLGTEPYVSFHSLFMFGMYSQKMIYEHEYFLQEFYERKIIKSIKQLYFKIFYDANLRDAVNSMALNILSQNYGQKSLRIELNDLDKSLQRLDTNTDCFRMLPMKAEQIKKAISLFKVMSKHSKPMVKRTPEEQFIVDNCKRCEPLILTITMKSKYNDFIQQVLDLLHTSFDNWVAKALEGTDLPKVYQDLKNGQETSLIELLKKPTIKNSC